MQLLTISDGILRVIGNKEDEANELKKANWDYRLTSASGQYMVIDYDKDKARPYVKALLAKVNKLREVKLLYFVVGFSILTFLIFTFLHVLVLIRIGDLGKDISKIGSTPNTIQQLKSTPVIDNSEFSDFIKTQTKSGAVEKDVKNNRLFQ